MLNLKFSRQENGIYISHTDILRSLNRTMRRAKINVAYSQGFNRHMIIKLTQPLPLGIASLDEWATFDVIDKISPEEFLKKFNDNCPPYIKGITAIETENNPSLSANVVASGYVIKTDKAFKYKEALEDLNKKSYVITYEKKGEMISKEISGNIHAIRVSEKDIKCVLSFGSVNLRIDNLCNQFNVDFGLDIKNVDIVRTRQLILDKNNTFISVEQFMEKVK